ncbi:MAG TPA: hypothetical protein VGP81_12050 [Pyrinomonadaceae bacterium]|nr:hypothetical protein [Pyrinomonadaceae bacterium]
MKNLFSKTKAIIALGIIVMFMTATALARAGKQDFVLHNETGVEIHEVYVSPVTAGDWEEDVLGKETLPNGEAVKITFDDRDKHSHWDLKVTDGKGTASSGTTSTSARFPKSRYITKTGKLGRT